MIHLTTTVPDQADRDGLDVIRVPATSTIRGIITSPGFVGTWTHFLDQRTRPCVGDPCNVCNQGIARRWYAWIGLTNPATHQHAILQLTPPAAKRLQLHLEQHPTLRGVTIEAHRPSGTPTGRISVRLKNQVYREADLPDEPDIIANLATIWGANPSEFAPAIKLKTA